MSDLYNGTFVRLLPGAIEELLEGPGGPVMRDAYGRGERINALARTKIRPSRVRVDREGAQPWSKSGPSLRDSGFVEYAKVPGAGAVILVRYKKRYATWVNDGTKPHVIPKNGVIRPKNGKVLSFYWPRLGQQVAFPKVNHPGTKGSFYLSGSIHAGADGGIGMSVPPSATDISIADLRSA